MTDNPTAPSADPTGLALLGLGAMGTALARAWVAAGHPVTAWNRTPRPAPPGTTTARTAAEAVAAHRLVVVCLLDDASVTGVLAGVDLAGRDLVNLTTSTPARARAQADAANLRGARFLDAGVMAVPPMVGSGDGHVFYSGSAEVFEAHRGVLEVPLGARFVGVDPGAAALHDVALLSAMNGMVAGILHAFALIRGSGVRPTELAPLLVDWLTAMAGTAHKAADQLESGDYRRGVVSSLAMQVAGNAALLDTAAEQGVRPDLLLPYFDLMRARLAGGHGDEDTTGVVELLTASR
ncbi:NAD(P)-binding domain-containing protein [Actinokineospora sp. PR83]|uniref:NAD(P)-dependent oxidoreductase n=1 Tax=Actinokineospora sp. PR83 TaxID=2884908 RepID=UPI001F431DC8|nr:NAD(P)-binding domain-containing protein [Actinokineospora sp. PR83]MCG8918187.1 NAD(P)-binding domain-containing protein [Actinokineospora sp. PR83]